MRAILYMVLAVFTAFTTISFLPFSITGSSMPCLQTMSQDAAKAALKFAKANDNDLTTTIRYIENSGFQFRNIHNQAAFGENAEEGTVTLVYTTDRLYRCFPINLLSIDDSILRIRTHIEKDSIAYKKVIDIN